MQIYRKENDRVYLQKSRNYHLIRRMNLKRGLKIYLKKYLKTKENNHVSYRKYWRVCLRNLQKKNE